MTRTENNRLRHLRHLSNLFPKEEAIDIETYAQCPLKLSGARPTSRQQEHRGLQRGAHQMVAKYCFLSLSYNIEKRMRGG